MKTSQVTKLKFSEIYALEGELFGVFNSEGTQLFKGILSQPLNIKSRYWLSRLGETVQAEKQTVEKLRESLIKELGTADEAGNYSLMPFLNDETKEVNPNFTKFQEDLTKLLEEEKEITHAVFTLDQFENPETTEHYPTFFKLLSVEED